MYSKLFHVVAGVEEDLINTTVPFNILQSSVQLMKTDNMTISGEIID